MSTTKRATLSDSQFEQLAKIIYTRAGIHFPAAKKYVLESRLTRRLTELEIEDFDQYIMLLSMGPYQTDEFQEMFNRITINETSFFRNEAQLNEFERSILPKLLEARANKKRLRVWSAACSTGEEPFTLAMLIGRTLGARLPDWNIEILGTDISERALNVANTGVYTPYAVRTTADMIKRRYFTENNGLFELNQDIRSMVNFELHNLKDKLAAKRRGLWDIIFCRNVMIYFDDDMRRGVFETFADVLAPDGALFIGHSESVRDVTDRFQSIESSQAFCYQPVSTAGFKTTAA